MNIYYKINLYLNLLKYSIREKYSEEKNKHVLFLKDYFKGRNTGFYIDVGCYHPVRLSNTKLLYDKGWCGINIDISEKSIDLFKISRNKDINLNIGIGDKDEISEAYFKKDLFHANTLVTEHAQKFLGDSIKKKIRVQTLNTVINKYAQNKKIDFIDIDCEGKDLEVLRGLDLVKNKIELISLEMHGYDEHTKKRGELILDIMKKNKFVKLYGNYHDVMIFQNLNYA
jgi:FkbM family methyltransferase